MNTLNSVYETINKIANKTELAKHEVELGLIEDTILLFDKGEINGKKAFDLRKNGRDIIKESNKDEKIAIDIYLQSLELGKKILTQMKELGLTDPKVNESIRHLKSKIETAQERIKTIEKAFLSF